MAATIFMLTVRHNSTGSTFLRDVPANKVAKFREKAEAQNCTILASRPIRSVGR